MVTFIVWNVLILLEKKTRLDFCNVIMPSKDIKILEFNQYKKWDKGPFIVYADFECLIEKTDRCKNNPEN